MPGGGHRCWVSEAPEAEAPDTPARAEPRSEADADHTRTAVDADGPGPDRDRELPRTALRREARVAGALASTAVWSARLLLVVAALLVVVYLLSLLWVVLLPVLLALLLATVLWPPARVLRRWLPPALAGFLVLLLALGLLAGTVVGLAPQVTGQAQELADQVNLGLEDVQGRLQGPPFNLGEDQVGNAVESLVGQLQTNAQTIASRAVNGVVAAGSLLVTGLLALVLCFFYLKDGPRFLPWLCGLVGPRAAPHAAAVLGRSWTTLGGFIRAQAAVGLVDAVGIGVGLVLLGVPLALPLAVLVFFGAFIPIVGAVVTGLLAALVALVSNGLTAALIVVGVVLLVQQLEGNVLQPILVGRSLDLHPALVILAVAAGGSLAGIVGAFLAVPVVAVGAVVVRYTRQQLAEVEPGADSPPRSAGQPSPPPEALR